jgi:hypothetical protein
LLPLKLSLLKLVLLLLHALLLLLHLPLLPQLLAVIARLNVIRPIKCGRGWIIARHPGFLRPQRRRHGAAIVVAAIRLSRLGWKVRTAPRSGIRGLSGILFARRICTIHTIGLIRPAHDD